MRRQTSQTQTTPPGGAGGAGGSGGPTTPLAFDDENSVIISPNTPSSDGNGGTSSPTTVVIQETVYGDVSQDAGDEVRFSVELTRIDRLNDTFSLDIRRLKGNLRSYKFLYDTLRQ
jgi:protein-serine/threonine kinase